MCYSPVRVRNSKRNFNPLTDRVFNEVACGHCGECQTDRRRSYYLRCLAEQQKMVMRIGNTKDTKVVDTAQVFFVTLTYNDKYLPRMLFPDGKYHSVFSHKDVSLFFHRLQIKLYRQGISFHRICTCEYGHGDLYKDSKGRTRKGTFRPHYHILLFLDHFVEPTKLQRLCIESWSNLVSKKLGKNVYDSYGKVFFGRKGDGTVTGNGAIKYVCKYVVKFDNDSFFMRYYRDLKDYNYKELVSQIHELNRFNEPISDDLYNQFLFCCALRESLPFVHTSINFGMALEYLDDFKVNYKLGKVYCANDSFDCKMFSKKDSQQINEWVLPLYYRRKRNYVTHTSPDFSRGIPDIKIFKYSPFEYRLFTRIATCSDSHLTFEHENELYDSINERFKNQYESYRSLVSSIVASKFIDVYVSRTHHNLPLSNLDLCTDKFLLNLTYYVMFNRGYLTTIDFRDFNNNYCLDTSFLFRSSADEDVMTPYIDENVIDNYEKVLKIFRLYNLSAGSIRDKEFAEEYKKFKIKKSYENAL